MTEIIRLRSSAYRSEGFSETEQLLEIPEEKEYFIAIHLQDVTELNRYIRANEEQRLVAGLVYIDNYEEVIGKCRGSKAVSSGGIDRP